MKKLAIVLLGMLAAVSSFAVFYLPLTTEPIENAILPTIVAAAVGPVSYTHLMVAWPLTKVPMMAPQTIQAPALPPPLAKSAAERTFRPE